jgi:hypothetical protein
MNEIETEPQVEAPERHPADRLNDGSALKFVFYVPALLLHTVIAGYIGSLFCSLAVHLLMVPLPLLRSPWFLMLSYYVLSLAIGAAWGRFLDNWLFGTSRYVWIIPAVLLAIVFVGLSASVGVETAVSWIFGRSLRWLAGATLPVICSAGYSLGAWIRRSTGDEIPSAVEASIGPSAWPETRNSMWSKAVKLWRAGRSVDYPEEQSSFDEKQVPHD